MVTRPFPQPGRLVAAAYRELVIAQYGTDEERAALGRIETLDRPWDPPSCRPAVRQQVWQWLDEVAAWVNHEYAWTVERLIPACWPAHPHLAHELAVLADQRRAAGQATGSDRLEDWHRYSLPMFADRLATRLGNRLRQPARRVARRRPPPGLPQPAQPAGPHRLVRRRPDHKPLADPGRGGLPRPARPAGPRHRRGHRPRPAQRRTLRRRRCHRPQTTRPAPQRHRRGKRGVDTAPAVVDVPDDSRWITSPAADVVSTRWFATPRPAEPVRVIAIRITTPTPGRTPLRQFTLAPDRSYPERRLHGPHGHGSDPPRSALQRPDGTQPTSPGSGPLRPASIPAARRHSRSTARNVWNSSTPPSPSRSCR